MYVEMKGVNKSFADCDAAKNVSFGVEKGKLAALLGPSGSGKTTILRIIAGLEEQDAGDVIIEGRLVNDIPAGERGIGFVFQSYALFRYMTVYENIAFGLRVLKKSRTQIHERVTELIHLVELDGLEKRYPNELSGGQRQRVAFARALAPNPQLLLLDEPFAAIDAKVRRELRTWLKRMIAQVGITSIFVTHDQDEAVEVADQIIVVNEGRVEQSGTPAEIYSAPATPFVAQFIGNSARVPDLHIYKGFDDVPAGSCAVIRPEFLETFKTGSEKFSGFTPAAETGIVRDIAFRGSYLALTIEVNGSLLAASRSLERRPIAVGDPVYVLVYRAYAIGQDGSVRICTNRAIEALGEDLE